MTMRVSPKLLNRVALAGLLSLSAVAATPNAFGAADEAQKGFEVAARSDRSDRGFGDSRVSLTMILRNAAGSSSIIRFTS